MHEVIIARRYFCTEKNLHEVTKLHKYNFAPKVNFARVTFLHKSKEIHKKIENKIKNNFSGYFTLVQKCNSCKIYPWCKIIFVQLSNFIPSCNFVHSSNFVLVQFSPLVQFRPVPEKDRLAFHQGFASQFYSNFLLTTAYYYLKKECKEWLDLVSLLFFYSDP